MGAEHRPPMDPNTDEASRKQLEAARAQGEAVERAARLMMEEVAEDGGQQRAGDYLVGYAVEKAEGMYHLVDGQLEWNEPEDENMHLEVIVRDGADGRLIPALDIRATLVSGDGDELGPFEMPFLWHPMIDHYGRNLEVPGDGEYTLRVHIDPPTFGRHDEVNGKRFAEPVDVEFPRVKVSTGQG
jgi:hypothetical protein